MGRRKDTGAATAAAKAALQVLLAQSSENRYLGRHVEGSAQAREAAGLAAEAGDAASVAAALRLLGMHLFRLGEIEESAKHSQQAVRILERLQDPASLAEAQCTLSIACVELGLHDEALQAVTEGLSAAEAAGDRTALCWAYNRMGVVYDAMDQRDKAREFLERALALSRQLNDAEALFGALNNLAENAIGLHLCHRDQQETADAAAALARGLAHVEESIRVARASHSTHFEAIGLCNYGMLSGLAQDYELGLRQLDQAQELSRTHGYRPLLLMAANYRADLLRLRGDGAAAIAEFRNALAGAPQQADKVLLMRMRLALSRAYKEAGQYREALEEYERYHALDREIGSAVAETRGRMIAHRVEADRARLEADRHKLRSAELEAEKHRLVEQSVELDRHANEDALTGLWNRRHFENRMPPLFEHARESGDALSIAAADIDRFKAINDRFGHAAGDEVLRRVAALLRTGHRASDLVARTGGEEFILVMEDCALAEAVNICERLRRNIADADWSDVHPDLKVTVSFGLGSNETATDLPQLLAEADARLYRAKRGGRNRVVASG